MTKIEEEMTKVEEAIAELSAYLEGRGPNDQKQGYIILKRELAQEVLTKLERLQKVKQVVIASVEDLENGASVEDVAKRLEELLKS